MKLKYRINGFYRILQIKLLALFSKKMAARKALTVFNTPYKRNNTKPSGRFLTGEPLHFDFNGISICGFRWNEGAKRKALVIHGHVSSVLNFEPYIDGLVKKGHEVLAFDAPAHGMSGGETINVVEFSDFILHIHEKFGPVQSYVGHSFGGLAIALAMEKIQHDESFRIALIAPATESISAIDRYFRMIHLTDEKVKHYFEEQIQEIGGHPSAWYSVARAMQHIKAKVLWVHDQDDPVTPFSDALNVKKQNYPNVQFVVTSGLGHAQIYRDKSVCKAIIDFL
ncbi:MAG: alpha/beta fold hydrolase [Chitinophagaceae bacterium]